MALTQPTRATIWEDGGATAMARVIGNAGTAITQASITTINYYVYDRDSATPDVAVSTGALTVSAVVFDTLQTDARWTIDGTGYNFRHALPASAFATPDHDYRVEYKFTPASGEVFWWALDIYAEAIVTS